MGKDTLLCSLKSMKHVDPFVPTVELLARPGTHHRTFTVTLSTDLSRRNMELRGVASALHFQTSTILDFYASAVGAGCFGDAPCVSINELDHRSVGVGVEVSTFTLELLPLPLNAIRPLLMKARSVNAFGGCLTHIVIEEQSHTSRRPDQIGLEVLKPLPAPELPFSIKGQTALSQCRIITKFGDAVSSGALQRTQAAIEAWVGMLSGGFEGSGDRFSTGRLAMAASALDTEVIVTLRELDISFDAWNAMARVLETIDREVQTIEHVEIVPV